MFRIGPKPPAIKLQPQVCCSDGQCKMCNQSIESDKFEKTVADKPSIKKVLPISIITGLAGAGAVVGVSTLLNKVTHSKSGLVTAMAVLTGFGIANGVMMQSLSKGKEKPNA